MGDFPGATVREADLYSALGVKYLPPIINPNGSVAPTSQHVYAQSVYLYAGEVVTNIINWLTVAGVGTAPTAIKLGVWSSAATPVCLALTADLAADSKWTSGTGIKSSALTAPYTILTTGVYYFTYWQNGAFGTTNTQFDICGNGSARLGAFPPFYGNVKTGATTLTVADTGAYGLSGNVPLLMGS